MATTYNPDEAPYVELSGEIQSVMALILKKYGASIATLRVVGNPDWGINPYKQERMPVWEALDRLVKMIGWDLRVRWLPNSRTRAQLTLSEPGRANPSVSVYNLGPDNYFSLERFESTTDDVRNYVVVAYGPAESRAFIVRKDQASIDRFRFPRVMWIEEGSDSMLQTEAEAIRLADAALTDLARPRETVVVKMPLFPLYEIGDTVDLGINDDQLKRTTRYNVIDIKHEIQDAQGTTSITLQADAPAMSRGAWKSLEVRGGVKYF